MPRAALKLTTDPAERRAYFDRYPLREAATLLDAERRDLGVTVAEPAAGTLYSVVWMRRVLAGQFTSAAFVDRADAFPRARRSEMRRLGVPVPTAQGSLF